MFLMSEVPLSHASTFLRPRMRARGACSAENLSDAQEFRESLSGVDRVTSLIRNCFPSMTTLGI